MAAPVALSAVPAAESKVDTLVQHCLYLIATGKWPAGMRLPSIRDAESAWLVNRLTVQRAYRELARRGLVTVRPRSGWFVGDRDAVRAVSRHRARLDELFVRIAAMIREETELSVLGSLRYLARLAEFSAVERPECAFVECTRLQAEAHARELGVRLGIPVLALTLDELAAEPGPPAGVRLLLTSLFHLPEVAPWAERTGVTVRGLPIAVDRDIAQLFAGGRETVLLETEEEMARNIAADLAYLGRRPQVRIVDDISGTLAAMFDDPYSVLTSPVILLSPRHWGTVPARWRSHPAIHQVAFTFTEAAMTEAAEALGLPLGAQL